MPRRKENPPVEANGDNRLLAVKRAAPYNDDEERFSVLLQRRVDDLLRGRRNRLLIMRKYGNNGDKLGVMDTPAGINRKALRMPVVERMLDDALLFLHDGTPGSPPSRERDEQNRILETQHLTTKWPHILLMRTDAFDPDSGEPLETVWSACRVQNQQRQIRINRLLDIANLGVELVRFIGIGR